MTAYTLDASAYEVAQFLPRQDGTLYVVVSHRNRRNGRAFTTFAAYRHEPGSGWASVNESWTSLDTAINEAPGVHRFTPLTYPPFIQLLADATGRTEATS